MVFDFKSYGCYPREYNREIHGVYDPSKYYGKPDTPFENVKLGELPAWLGRRSLNPRKWAQALSRWYWRYQLKWVQPRVTSAAWIYHLGLGMTAFFYFVNYHRLQQHSHFKYH